MRVVAIVDDSPEDASVLSRLVTQYFEGEETPCRIVTFKDGFFLLDGYTPVYDLILMDVEMRFVNGLDCARQLREVDAGVPIVFTTRMAQYAVDGYNVGAVGYLVKPVNGYALKLTLDRVLRDCRERPSCTLWLSNGEEKRSIQARDVDYIEVFGHDLCFHVSGEIYHDWGTLKELSERLSNYGFSLCSRYCLVNLFHVERLRPETIVVSGDELSISRRNRTRIKEELMELHQRGVWGNGVSG